MTGNLHHKTLEAEDLARKQSRISASVRMAIEEIALLEQPTHYDKERRLLTTVANVMDEAEAILARPDTGPDAIAAETAAIELLLEARRNSAGGGGSGQDSGGGTGDDATLPGAALAALESYSTAPLNGSQRAVRQATGQSGRELPEEFRSGLDAYFHALEKRHDNH
jgi:hypothetical protein